MSEQQAGAAVGCSGLLAVLGRASRELFGVDGSSCLDRSCSGASPGLVGAEHGGDDESHGGLCKGDVAQSGDGRGDAIGDPEQWTCDDLDGLEGALDRRLCPRVTFSLGSVLDLELIERADGLGRLCTGCPGR